MDDDTPPIVTELVKHNKMLIFCDCDCTFPCPQGKMGSQTRCRVWVEKRHVSPEGKKMAAQLNKFNR